MKRLLIYYMAISFLAGCGAPKLAAPQLDPKYDPCIDARYLELKAKGPDKLTEAEMIYFAQKESDCFTYQLELAKYGTAKETIESATDQTELLVTVLAVIAMGAVILVATGK